MFSDPHRQDTKPVAKPRVIPAATITKAVERLSHAKQFTPDFSPVSPRRTLPKLEMDMSVDRLYSQTIAKHKGEMEKLLTEHQATSKPFQLPRDVMTDSVVRLCDTAMKRNADVRQNLRAQYLAKKIEAPKLSKEAVIECNVRVYDTGVQKKKDADSKLHAKYIQGTLPNFGKRSEKDWLVTTMRLSAKDK